jgi:large subunit ribosomal protein L21
LRRPSTLASPFGKLAVSAGFPGLGWAQAVWWILAGRLNLGLETMYAIFEQDGRQYQATTGDILKIDLREEAAGTVLTFDRVLAIADGPNSAVGQPTVAGAVVRAEILGKKPEEKLVVQKFRRRKNSRRRTGHRQWMTEVRITEIGR